MKIEDFFNVENIKNEILNIIDHISDYQHCYDEFNKLYRIRLNDIGSGAAGQFQVLEIAEKISITYSANKTIEEKEELWDLIDNFFYDACSYLEEELKPSLHDKIKNYRFFCETAESDNTYCLNVILQFF
ncbi:MAG: hypothetical protein ACTSQY_00785 [Candidatus Odinarchaeia archaeon]